jgi:hypothetical protein
MLSWVRQKCVFLERFRRKVGAIRRKGGSDFAFLSVFVRVLSCMSCTCQISCKCHFCTMPQRTEKCGLACEAVGCVLCTHADGDGVRVPSNLNRPRPPGKGATVVAEGARVRVRADLSAVALAKVEHAPYEEKVPDTFFRPARSLLSFVLYSAEGNVIHQTHGKPDRPKGRKRVRPLELHVPDRQRTTNERPASTFRKHRVYSFTERLSP